jgi:hypothetical protein
MPLASLSEIWCVDFEFQPEGGNEGGRPVPLVMVAREYRSGRTIRWWRDELVSHRRAPFEVGATAALCAYFASAEVACFIALGWPTPYNVIDLYAEYRLLNNGGRRNHHRSLIEVMRDNDLPCMSEVHKQEMRGKVLNQSHWSQAEKTAVLDYCAEDVDAAEQLLRRVEHRIDLPRALLRGRYLTACAWIEWTGIPLDIDFWNRLMAHRVPVLQRLALQEDAPYGVYAGGLYWSDKRFDQCIRQRGHAWPRTSVAGRPVRDDDTFKMMCELYPDMEGLRQLQRTIKMLQQPNLQIGPDGRNWTLVSPFGTVTGRNTPKARQFIFGAARWLRGLIKPAPGRALAYVDWQAQEVAIAAALSGDPRLLADYLSGDPYLSFAIAVGLAPEGATKHSHQGVRDLIKTLFLATNYGQSTAGLAV